MAKRVRKEDGKKGDGKKSSDGPSTYGKQSLDGCLSVVERKYGKGLLIRITDSYKANVDIIPTGSMLLDKALIIGGMPRGRLVELFGEPSGGKTTAALSVIAQAQKMGLVAAFIDAENSLDIGLAKGIGVDVDSLFLSQPDYGEQALDLVEILSASGAFGILVVDSVAALIPKKELDGEILDEHIGLQARMMGKAMRRLTKIVANSNTCVIFINQTRMKIGVLFGNPLDTPGGKALKFYSSIRLDVCKSSVIKKDNDLIGHKLKMTVVKNKLAPPFRSVETDLIYGKGFSTLGELLDLACSAEIVERNGPWYSYGDERLGQGREAACTLLENTPDLVEKIMTDLDVESD